MGSGGPSPYRDLDEEILERLVALNHERAEEEKNGKIRWLRPEFQNPGETKPAVQKNLIETEDGGTKKAKAQKPKTEKVGTKSTWPKTLSEQVNSVHRALNDSGSATTADALSKNFKRANKERIAEILETLAALGKARATENGKYQS